MTLMIVVIQLVMWFDFQEEVQQRRWSVSRGGLHRSGDVRRVVDVSLSLSCAVRAGRAECWLVGPTFRRRLARCLFWWESELVTGIRRICLNNRLCGTVAPGGICRVLHNLSFRLALACWQCCRRIIVSHR